MEIQIRWLVSKIIGSKVNEETIKTDGKKFASYQESFPFYETIDNVTQMPNPNKCSINFLAKLLREDYMNKRFIGDPQLIKCALHDKYW